MTDTTQIDKDIDHCLTNLDTAMENWKDMPNDVKGVMIQQIAALTNMVIVLYRLKIGASNYDGKRGDEK